MRVSITKPPGIFAEGVLGTVISEQNTPSPSITIEMRVAGVDDPVEVVFNECDLITIVRLARASTSQKIQDAVKDAHP